MRRNAPKKQKEWYSGKQKYHTIKDQLLINRLSGEIICVAEAKGAVHDFELFKLSGIHMLDDILLVADKGYQGISGVHPLV